MTPLADALAASTVAGLAAGAAILCCALGHWGWAVGCLLLAACALLTIGVSAHRAAESAGG